MHRPPAWIAALLVVGLSASGCHQPLPPAPSVTPEPTFACTPEAGGGPSFSCDRRQHEEMVVKEALYAEAERVYREFYAEDVRIQWQSTEDVASEKLKQLVTGQFLVDVEAAYRSQRKLGLTGAGAVPTLNWLKRAPAESVGGSLVALESCVDASSAEVLKEGKPFGRGVKTRNKYFFIRIDGRLLIHQALGAEVKEC